jgi:hypothetical protein
VVAGVGADMGVRASFSQARTPSQMRSDSWWILSRYIGGAPRPRSGSPKRAGSAGGSRITISIRRHHARGRSA